MGCFLSRDVIQAWMLAGQLRWQLIQLGQGRIYSKNSFLCFPFLFWGLKISSAHDAVKLTGFFWGGDDKHNSASTDLYSCFGFEILKF